MWALEAEASSSYPEKSTGVLALEAEASSCPGERSTVAAASSAEATTYEAVMRRAVVQMQG